MSYKIEKLEGPLSFLGEGPHWDVETQNLYYIDIYKVLLHRYSYKDKKTYTASIPNENAVSFVIPVEGEKDKFALGLGRRVGIAHWDGVSKEVKLEKIAFEVETDSDHKNNRFNDAKADPVGRLYCGTMRIERDTNIFDHRLGSLYSYMKGEGLKKLRTNIGVSNGLAWNDAAKKMYFIDSVDLNVREFNYDKKTGAIDDGRVLIDFCVKGERPNFVPDGMTIDNKGFLYVATFGASKIFKVDPKDGKIVLTIDFPCEQITSCAFGGPNLDILYVTSAFMGEKDGVDKPAPAGGTFQVTGLGAKGTPMTKVKL